MKITCLERLHVFITLNNLRFNGTTDPKRTVNMKGKKSVLNVNCQAGASLELQLHAHMTESRTNAVNLKWQIKTPVQISIPKRTEATLRSTQNIGQEKSYSECGWALQQVSF
jgi:hypothetical protein